MIPQAVMEDVLVRWILTRGNAEAITRYHPTGWFECDVFGVTRSRYWFEIEIKRTKADFCADFDKTEKHAILRNLNRADGPRRFFYAVPEGLISPREIPEYAGLIYVCQTSKKGLWPRIEMPAVTRFSARRISPAELDKLREGYKWHYYKALIQLARKEEQCQ